MSAQMNAATAVESSSGYVEMELLAFAWNVFVSARAELLLFVAAVVAYFVLFMQRSPKKSSKHQKKMKFVEDEFNDEDCANGAVSPTGSVLDPKEYASVEKALQTAFDAGDHRSVLRCWSTMKKFERMPNVSLPHVVESMQRFKKDMPFVLRELKCFFKKFPGDCDIVCINDLLEALAKRMDSDLMEKIVEMLPSVGLEMDQCTYEVFLGMHFTTRNFQEVMTLVEQMRTKQIPFTTRSSIAVIKTALKMNNFDEALLYFGELKKTMSGGSLAASPSAAPAHVVSQLVELACREHKLSQLLAELRGTTLSEEVINAMLLECVRQKDLSLTQRVEEFAREQGAHFTDATYALLIKGSSADAARVQELFEEALEKHAEVTADFVNSVLAYCGHAANTKMAEKLYEHMKPQQLSVLSSFVRFFADNEQYDKACDIYEQDIIRLHSAPEDRLTLTGDARMERSLMNAALKCGRTSLAQNMLSSSPSDIAKHITMIRNCAAANNLKGAFGVFDSLEKSGIDLNSVIYNTVLDACVECHDLQAAEKWMEHTKQAGMADVVSFNTLIKAHLQNKNFGKARALMEEIKNAGLQPNRVTFNELINALVNRGGEAQRRQMWDIVEEMTEAGVKPNQVTISILLKSLNSYSREADILKTMDLIDTMDEPMDEVLLSSVVEACVRIGKPDLLVSKLKQLQSHSNIVISGSHTYGSLIKAHGHAKDIDGVWRCWKEMRSRHIKPTSITVGCMVEAIVGNGDTEGAYDLINQMQDDEQCSGALNSIIYCSVLKGFTREKKIDRAWEVYEEMKTRGTELSVITYNTLIDACARCGRMESLPKILEDMKEYRIKPNLISYSTMLKGHCNNGDIQTAFSILDDMRKNTSMKPDEIMYNSLLDGCAQSNLIEEGLRLLEEMQSEGVQPSNFTLSILVKLMNRARRLEQAFSLVESITKKYGFKPNVHVYTNLVQACVSNQQLQRGMNLLEQMVQERITPDSRTYAILVRGCMHKGMFDQAVGLIRGALGLPDAPTFLQKQVAVCYNIDYAFVNETLGTLADRGHAKDLAVPLMSSIKQHSPKVRIDRATQQRIMSPCLPTDTNLSPTRSFGKGKGKGQ